MFCTDALGEDAVDEILVALRAIWSTLDDG